MDTLKAYGAGMASGKFDPLAYIKKPSVILRLVSWVFSIIVFGCITSEGYHPVTDICLMNNDRNACGYGVGIGVVAFLGCTVFLFLDAIFDNLSSIQHRKYAVMADLGLSGVWAFFWFVGFCYMTDAWRKATPQPLVPDGYGKSNIEAAIAFSFFSIFTFAGLTYFAFMKYREGSAKAFSPGFQEEGGVAGAPGAPYSTYPGGPESTEPYQEPPFSQMGSAGAATGAADYQAPAY